MTTKLKRKGKPRSTNPITHWWNEFLFSRSIEVETTLSPDECALRLRGLEQEHSGCLNPGSVTSEVHQSGGGASFDIRIMRGDRDRCHTAVKAEGVLVPIADSGVTLVRGTVKFGWVYYFLALFPILCAAFILISFHPSASYNRADNLHGCLAVPLIAVMMLFYVRLLFVDRSTLLNAVVAALDDSADKPRRKRS